MMIKVQDILDSLYKLAPVSLAFDWDNVGLQLGSRTQEISSVLLCLDVDNSILDEALGNNCQLIISHHPFFFNSLKNIDLDSKQGNIIKKFINKNISLLSFHTNLDIAVDGLNDYLAEKLEVYNCQNLKVLNYEKLYKLIVYIPESHYERVKMAILDAGAGWFGNYSHTSFSTEGRGTFKPLPDSQPYLGKKGVINTVDEIRFETIIKEDDLETILKVMINEHPYEEIAYDLYNLTNKGREDGIGRIGRLRKACTLKEYLDFVKRRLGLKQLRFVGENNRHIRTVALCCGSGSDLIESASKAGADLYISGDIKYHDAQLADRLDMALLDAGHYETEIIVKELLREYLSKEIKGINYLVSSVNTNPWKYRG
ncbi:Nif3-like dinuclear metal center hexameric protein [Halocella sp. SP3-1]|uniref:Nif3-like dinuclear metal center hexameric protein n=1 Tax=Halocella sp. SP3-1 TaxID=2382161 RepID=UPI000F7616B3|nr:Nif3-like dinuclear metal center hexameric protein [Halocella sp. SP3-1]AZO95031.1 Nif3-like dinuclear metal center hexameric protein [Halocella sp. SP3-1]